MKIYCLFMFLFGGKVPVSVAELYFLIMATV